MTKSIAILGASGHGKVVADAALAAGWSEVVFYDDAWPDVSLVGTWPVAGTGARLFEDVEPADSVIVGIGSNAIRLGKLDELASRAIDVATVVHPRSTISRFVAIEPGSAVFAGAVVNVDAWIGRGAIINTGATVDHDCILGEAVHISPGAHLAGNVEVGDRTWIGIGAVVKQGVRIGKDVMVAAGAVVIRDIPDGAMVMGVPASVR